MKWTVMMWKFVKSGSQNSFLLLWILAVDITCACIRNRSSHTVPWRKSTNRMKPNAACWGTLMCSLRMPESAACFPPTWGNISTREKGKRFPSVIICLSKQLRLCTFDLSNLNVHFSSCFYFCLCQSAAVCEPEEQTSGQRHPECHPGRKHKSYQQG